MFSFFFNYFFHTLLIILISLFTVLPHLPVTAKNEWLLHYNN